MLRVGMQKDQSPTTAAFKPNDCSKSGSKNNSVYFSDKDSKHYRDNRGRGGSTLPSYSLLHITCACDDTDIDTMYHRCCISTSNSFLSNPITTQFDTDANPTSFVNRQVAAWIELQQEQQTPDKHKHSAIPLALVSIAGTSLTSPIYGSVV
jgi:hypothetical protein